MKQPQRRSVLLELPRNIRKRHEKRWDDEDEDEDDEDTYPYHWGDDGDEYDEDIRDGWYDDDEERDVPEWKTSENPILAPFVFNLSSQESASFLRRIPDAVRQRIRSVVLTAGVFVMDERGNQVAWSKQRNSQSTPFAALLRRALPRLSEIAIHVPATSHEKQWHSARAPIEVRRMLEEGVVDVVRFLYSTSVPNIMKNCVHLGAVNRPHDWREENTWRDLRREV
ncbi:Uu.00g051080.m01.CDS01 [Anthostomella pinea]|uniref:Uu.00g051080.m01.CDS01 n=1 Tax=Anthostomella pinea TaxID=933095 RepID=A0AAI8VM71_9PEZI|nr:Uu.00g051080.m01.CDS01 [Anthostomella pinea]